MKGKIEYAGHEGFWNTRFRLLEQNLSPEHAAHFRASPLAKKKYIVGGMILKGHMI